MQRPACVTERDWAIVLAHLRDKRTLAEAGEPCGIGREQVRQIVSRVARGVLRELLRQEAHG
jgi:DNA-directed RNA polymerase sigma subunit (sigma70/sigma32)